MESSRLAQAAWRWVTSDDRGEDKTSTVSPGRGPGQAPRDNTSTVNRYKPPPPRQPEPELIVLARARTWLHSRVKDHSSDIAALLQRENGVRDLLQPFLNDLTESERKLLKTELLAEGFPGTSTLDMLRHWATARLRVRLNDQVRVAVWGPPTQYVSGGHPGLGKRR